MRSDLAEVELSDVARRRRQARRRTIGVVGVAVMLPVFAILAGPSGGETAPEIAANRTVAFTNAGQDQNAPAAVDGSADESLDLSEPTRRVNLDPVLPSAEPESSDLAVGSAPTLDPAPVRPATAAPRSTATPAQNPTPTSDAPTPVPTSLVEGVVSGVAVANVASLPAEPTTPAAPTTEPETTTTASSDTTASTEPEPADTTPPATTEPPTTEPPTTEPPTTDAPVAPTEPPAPDPAPPVEPVEDDALSTREEKKEEREQKKEEREQIKADRFDE